METPDALAAFAALSQETRLAAFRLLVTAGPAGMPAGQIADELGIAANTLSFHLAALKNAGLVGCRRESRSLIYSVDYPRMRALVDFMTENCCARAKD
ncbi:MAG: ArsR/SmtB family transcription factor [Solirubrobacterales bacterium]